MIRISEGKLADARILDEFIPEPGAFYVMDPKDGKVLVFLTNNFDLPALTIAHLYKLRWRVELFFKWIKQNLRIKHFFGTTDHAVKTQVWIAVCVYVLPLLQLDRSLAARTLTLNCMTTHYAELWQECWDAAYREEAWLGDDPRLDADF